MKFDGIGTDFELGTSSDYGRIEYAYNLMAKEAGIDMMPCRILEENGRANFMTKRFDRDGDKKHHVQSLCAMSHLDYKQRATHSYGQLFLTISQLHLGDDALQQAFLRMAFNVMARNCDDHTKNFAFILRDSRVWSLSPAYDFTHAHNPKGEWTYRTDVRVLLEWGLNPMVVTPLVEILSTPAQLSAWVSKFSADSGLIKAGNKGRL